MDTILKIILSAIEGIIGVLFDTGFIDERSVFGKIVIAFITLSVLGVIIWLIVKLVLYLIGVFA